MATMADYFGAQPVAGMATTLAKSEKGEGSRGGHIIGHTRSGKPIYGPSHERHAGLKHLGGDRKTTSIYEATNHNAALARKTHPEYTQEDHADAAKEHYELMQAGTRVASRLPLGHSARSHLNDLVYEHEAVADAHDHAAYNLAHVPRLKSEPSPKKPAKVIGMTPGGHPVHAATSEHYNGMHFPSSHGKGSVGGSWAYRKSKDKQRDKLMAERFGHFSDADHQTAIQLHLHHRNELERAGKTRAAEKANDAAVMHSSARAR